MIAAFSHCNGSVSRNCGIGSFPHSTHILGLTMWGSELKKMINKDAAMKQTFRGVFARNQLPNLSSVLYDSSYIVNSSPSTQVEGHWLLIFLKSKTRTVFFFDPSGQPPGRYRLRSKLIIPGWKFVYNNLKLQPSHSKLCGLYVLRTLYLLSRGWPLKAAMKSYSCDPCKNDALVKNFARSHFGYHADVQMCKRK